MQTIHAGNMKKSAFIRSQLEACKIGQKVKGYFKKAVFYLYFRSTVKSIPFEPALKGWVQKMRAEGGGGRKGKRRKKWGSNFYESVCMFFQMRSGHFSNI